VVGMWRGSERSFSGRLDDAGFLVVYVCVRFFFFLFLSGFSYFFSFFFFFFFSSLFVFTLV
jgi:hypothetical protein